MIYTIGNTIGYEAMFDTYPPERCIKVGRRLEPWYKTDAHGNPTDREQPPYDGGIAFPSIAIADLYIKRQTVTGYACWSVYGLLCGWDNTYRISDRVPLFSHRLVNDTQLVRLAQKT